MIADKWSSRCGSHLCTVEAHRGSVASLHRALLLHLLHDVVSWASTICPNHLGGLGHENTRMMLVRVLACLLTWSQILAIHVVKNTTARLLLLLRCEGDPRGDIRRRTVARRTLVYAAAECVV